MTHPSLFDPPPYVAGSETSKKAAELIRFHRISMRDRVLSAIRRYGPVTDQEIASILDMPENSVRPRRVELQRAGKIWRTGTAETSSGRRAQTWTVR